MHRLTVLISGGGTNLQAIIDAIESKSLEQVEIGLVLSNRKNAGGLERAKRHSINTTILSLKGKDRQDYDSELASLVLASNPDLIVLAGFMHILSGTFLNRISTIPIINLHPALPGEFDGANAISRAFKSWSAGEISRTGVMVHKVVAEVCMLQLGNQEPL